MNTNPLLSLSVDELRRAAQLKEQIENLNGELASILGSGGDPSKSADPVKRRGMSAAGRRRIAEAAKARWAKVRAQKGGASGSTSVAAPKKRTMSAAARKKIAEAAKARWAKFRAEKGKQG